MKLQFAFLADAATMLPQGLFDLQRGGVDCIVGSSFPGTCSLNLIARIQFESFEMGKKHELLVRLLSAKGDAIYPDSRIAMEPLPNPRSAERPNWMTIHRACPKVIFPAPGDYVFLLSIGEQVLGQVNFEVVVESKQ